MVFSPPFLAHLVLMWMEIEISLASERRAD
jgi:hypothetical protein